MYEVRALDIGLTTRCNAGCPQCDRTDATTNKAFSFLKMEELYLDDIKKIVPPDLCKNIERFSLCGGYGDPLVARDVLEIIEYFLEHASSAGIYIATNGSMKKPASWWHRLGKILKNKKCEITFGIDGINQEMHEKYRVHTNLETIFRNVEILQLYKIKCRWQYLVFNYNKEYVEQARKLAYQKKFSDFVIITTTRTAVGEFAPPDVDIIATSRDREYNYFKNTEFNSIDCLSTNNSEIHITASGVIVPCCYIDGRYHTSRYSQQLLDYYNINIEDIPEDDQTLSDINLLYKEKVFDKFNAKIHGLQKVLEDPWWDTFFKYQKEFKIHKCNDVCGKCV